jgi:hypothetical protein
MVIQSGKFGALLDFGATSAYIESLIDIADGQWHRVGMIRINNTLEAYVDGASIGRNNNAGGNLSNGNPLLIGVEQGLSLDYTGYIDDIIFPADLPPMANLLVFLSENFSAPWVPCSTGYYAPPGWTVDGICTSHHKNQPAFTHYWSRMDDAQTGTSTSHSTPYSAGLMWSDGHGEAGGSKVQNEWLISPELDVSDYVNLELEFWSIYATKNYGQGANEHNYVKASTDGGATWDILGDLCHDEEFCIPSIPEDPAQWNWYDFPVTINLSAYDGQTSLIIAWNVDYAGTGPRGLHCIDDVQVEGTFLHHIVVVPDPVTILVGDTCQFIATAYDEFNNTIPGIDFTWSTDVGTITATGYFTAQSANATGTVTATNGTVSGSANVTVENADPPVADAGADQKVPPGSLVAFNGSASYDPWHMGEPIHDGIVNWTWTFDYGGPVTLYNMNPTYLFNTSGIYAVTLVVRDAMGLMDTDQMNVSVYEFFDIDITEATLSNDWILLSFPGQIEGDPLVLLEDWIDEIGGGAGYVQWDIVQWFDPTSLPNTKWKTTATYKPPLLNTFTYVNNTMAFWMHITDYGDGQLSIKGPVANSGDTEYIYLKAGWNLVGYPFSVAQPVSQTFGMSMQIVDMWCYDPSQPYNLKWFDWWGVEPHEPGHGYWALALADEILAIQCP